MTSETYLEGELGVCRSLGKSFFTFLAPARDALAALLREHEEDEQTKRLMRGELVELHLGNCQIATMEQKSLLNSSSTTRL